jgi:hypothetical protein
MSDFTPPLDEGRDASPAARGNGFNGERGRRIAVDPSRSMRAITAEVAALFDGSDERPRQCGALLASELIAQVAGPTRAVHLEAVGPVAPTINGTAHGDVAPPDPNKDWGTFLIDRLADRWGLSGGARQSIWVDIAIPA